MVRSRVTVFYLLRHGQTLWSLAREHGLKGWGNDLVPLTTLGVEQIVAVAAPLRRADVQIVLCSPMTRALQSAAILSRLLDVPLTVEFDLHEWVPDCTFTWDNVAVVDDAFAEFTELGGEWPPGEQRAWEPRSRVRERMLGVLSRYRHLSAVAVVGHGVAISSLIGHWPKLPNTASEQARS